MRVRRRESLSAAVCAVCAELDAEKNAVTTAKRTADRLKHEQRESKRRRIAENGSGHVYVNLYVRRYGYGYYGGPDPPQCDVILEVNKYGL